MIRQNITFCLVFIVLTAAPAFVRADEEKVSASETFGGLTCFSITPPDVSTIQNAKSCKAFCAEKGAACTGVTNGALNPPPKCEDPAPPNFAVCRCCKVGEEKGGGDSVP